MPQSGIKFSLWDDYLLDSLKKKECSKFFISN